MYGFGFLYTRQTDVQLINISCLTAIKLNIATIELKQIVIFKKESKAFEQTL